MASVTLDWIQLAAVVGTLQGLLLTGVLFAQRNNRTANRLLAALMIAFTIYLATVVYYGTGIFRVYPHFFGIAYVTPWLFGPLTYLYAVAASDRAWRFERRDLWHLAPAALVLLVALPYYLMSGGDKLAMYDQLAAGKVPRRIALIDPLKFVSGITYSIATVRYLRRHGRQIEDNYSNVARVNLHWLLWLAGAAAATWLLATILAIVGPPEGFRDDYVAVAIAVIASPRYSATKLQSSRSSSRRWPSQRCGMNDPDSTKRRLSRSSSHCAASWTPSSRGKTAN
jgi:hypothetical protein